MKIVHEQAPQTIDTSKMFSAGNEVDNLSPIDEFISAVIRINALCHDPKNFPRELGHLMVLGFVSAVESYFRSLIRELVNSDPASFSASQRQSISFAAAFHGKDELKAEALVEHISFTSERRVVESFVNFLGFKKGSAERGVKSAIGQYEKVCQLRHCVAHRFGKLGSQNAIALDYDSHIAHIEKKIDFDYEAVQKIANVCDNFVRGINNFCYQIVLNRSYHDDWNEWSGDLRRDKRNFEKYYRIFSSKKNIPKSPELKNAFYDFRNSIILEPKTPGNWWP